MINNTVIGKTRVLKKLVQRVFWNGIGGISRIFPEICVHVQVKSVFGTFDDKAIPVNELSQIVLYLSVFARSGNGLTATLKSRDMPSQPFSEGITV